ncbi:MAG: protein-L-isoaspartate(D-aspartate) O-methyltransferase [Candidatus Korarchaeota archaeon]
MDPKSRKKKIVEAIGGYVQISEKVLNALAMVPREEFVPPHLRNMAYIDTPLPLKPMQTISAIHMVAIMCEILDLQPGHKVLEVGGGSGYHAAVCSLLVAPEGCPNPGHVYSIEIDQELAERAKMTLHKLGFTHVTMICGDGTRGLPEFAPYDRILVTAAAPDIPPPLLEQLKDGGYLVIPIGRDIQQLVLAKKERNEIEYETHGLVSFVPLVGKYGFRDFMT